MTASRTDDRARDDWSPDFRQWVNTGQRTAESWGVRNGDQVAEAVLRDVLPEVSEALAEALTDEALCFREANMFAAGVRHAARLVAGWTLAPKEKERP